MPLGLVSLLSSPPPSLLPPLHPLPSSSLSSFPSLSLSLFVSLYLPLREWLWTCECPCTVPWGSPHGQHLLVHPGYLIQGQLTNLEAGEELKLGLVLKWSAGTSEFPISENGSWGTQRSWQLWERREKLIDLESGMAIMDWMILGFSLSWRVLVYASKIMGVSFNSPKFLFGWKLFNHPNGMWNERKEGRREKEILNVEIRDQI